MRHAGGRAAPAILNAACRTPPPAPGRCHGGIAVLSPTTTSIGAATGRTYLPAAGHDVFLPLYDPLQRILGGDRARAELIREAALLPGHRVLDIGCGTGSLVTELGRLHPEVEVVGLDPDPKALARARRKLERAGRSARLDRAFADDMPYETGSFDRVFSSLMFHHLGPAEKKGTLAEVARVLAPGGELHLLDLARADRTDRQRDGFFARLLHSHTHDQDGQGIVALFVDAGFLEVREVSSRKTFFIRIANFSGKTPSEAA